MAVRGQVSERDTREHILRRAMSLFAEGGYAGVSVRDVAAGVGMSAAALYHHFPDKQALHLAAMEYAFARNEYGIVAALQSELPPLEQLGYFVTRFATLVAGDVEFCKLVQRELLDSNKARLEILSQHVFRRPHAAIVALARELRPRFRPLHAGRFRDRPSAVQFPDRAAAASSGGARRAARTPRRHRPPRDDPADAGFRP